MPYYNRDPKGTIILTTTHIWFVRLEGHIDMWLWQGCPGTISTRKTFGLRADGFRNFLNYPCYSHKVFSTNYCNCRAATGNLARATSYAAPISIRDTTKRGAGAFSILGGSNFLYTYWEGIGESNPYIISRYCVPLFPTNPKP